MNTGILELLKCLAWFTTIWLILGIIGCVIAMTADIYEARRRNWECTIGDVLDNSKIIIWAGLVGFIVAISLIIDDYRDSQFHKDRVQRRADRKRLRKERRKEKFKWWYSFLDTPIVVKKNLEKDIDN